MHIFSFSGEAVGEKKNENNIFFEQARSGKDLLLWPNDDNEKQLNLKNTFVFVFRCVQNEYLLSFATLFPEKTAVKRFFPE